ncbi:hypothetical protein PHYPSEUDO_014481 [Phytophthora pseudosyringae]|uniref:Uncharacterized protein n=1 Tax=Phytophthora pseudosyringae TaxID=221518 RepID=A0A8T1W0H8_9STRA|nr:hypothetical protein PHYPSEUDO_014481 [Phytophthora pseudosyringae]
MASNVLGAQHPPRLNSFELVVSFASGNMDRGRRAEPYSNATIWTREIARNLAGHLSRVSKAHSCVDTRSPKSTRLPQFQNSHAQKRCPTSPVKTRQPLLTISRNTNRIGDQELDYRGLDGGSTREETDGAGSANHTPEVEAMESCSGKQEFISNPNNGIPQLETHCVNPNQEVSTRPVRIPAIKPPARQHIRNGNANSDDMVTYESPPILAHQRHHLAHDYYKRQEQRKIWQENQVLIKRLQSTKATLDSKKWEKDGKWSQDFLKNQEKRRYALQQELRRAQVSPQALMRSKPLKALHPQHVKVTTGTSYPGTNSDFTCLPSKAADVSSARDSARRGSKGQVLLGSPGSSDATVLHSSAANHRRIMKLRKQKPNSVEAEETPSTESVPVDAVAPVASAKQAAFIPYNEIVTVRFTFSRGRSRGADTNMTDIDQTDQPGSLEVDGGDRDMMSLSGAFSPGAELETALNAVAVDDADPNDHPRKTETPEAGAGAVDEVPVEACDSYRWDTDFHDNNAQDAVAEISDVDEQTSEKVLGEVAAAAHATDTQEEGNRSPPAETEHDQSDEEQEEGYDGDNFDADPLPSARATKEQHDKLEASGYASEFEDEPGGDAHDNAPGSPPNDKQEATQTDNQEENNDEEEYSHDDFE